MKRSHGSRLPSSVPHFSLSLLPLLRLTPYALLLTFLVVLPAFSQPGWERTYGGTGADEGQSVQQTFDGGYIIAGFLGGDVYLIKTDAFGDTLWTKTYGGVWGDRGYSVQQTSDSGYIVAGSTFSFEAEFRRGDVYLIKTDTYGDTLWTKIYGTDSTDVAYSVQQTSDGGYIIGGVTNFTTTGASDVYLVKTDSNGDSLWARSYGGLGFEGAYSLDQTSDGGYILTGWTDSFGAGATDVYVVKTDSSGDTLWTKTYGGTSWEGGESVQQTSDGGYIIVGETYSFGNFDQVYLIKMDASGDTLWTRTYGGTDTDWGNSVWQTSDGGYIIAGGTRSFGSGGSDVYLIKTNASGDTLWTRTYGGTGNDQGRSVQQTSDSGYIITGRTNSFGAGNYDVYLIKTDSNGRVGVEDKKASPPVHSVPFSICPNPFISFASIPYHETERFELYDISGRNVGTFRGDRIGEGLSAGVYFLRPSTLTPQSSTPTLRIVKVR